MPPRYAYWTILIDQKPTAFRAREREELLPTFHQLRRKNSDVVMKWFARGRLWDSPAAAQAAQRAPKPPLEKRGRDWRPGGEHRDPRDRFKKGSHVQSERSGSSHHGETPSSRPPSASRGSTPPAGPPRNARPWTSKPPGGPPRNGRPWSAKPPTGGTGGRPRSSRPWSEKPKGGPPRAVRPWSGKPSGQPRDNEGRDRQKAQRPPTPWSRAPEKEAPKSQPATGSTRSSEPAATKPKPPGQD